MSDNSSQGGGSAVGQTANISRSTSVASGAAKVFREFKWGLLTLFLLMVVVVGLVYDGGKRKNKVDNNPAKLPALPEIALDGGVETALPPLPPGTIPGAPGALIPSQGEVAASRAPIIENPNLTSAPEQSLGAVQPSAPAQTPVAATPHGAPQTVVAPQTNPSTPAPSGSEKTYVVKEGDTLTKIAGAMLPGKGGVKTLLAANKEVLSDPNKLKVGMLLKIPAAAPVAANKTAAPALNSAASSAPVTEVVKPTATSAEYVVQSGDTLERIARKVLNDGRRWKDLFEWNREQLGDPSRLRVGQVLKLKNGSGQNAHAEVVEPLPEGLPKTASTEHRVDVQNDIRVMSTAASLP